MPIDEKKGLSRTNFGSIVREARDNDGKFQYALIRYGAGVCFIDNEDWFNCMKDFTVIPGSIDIAYDDIMTYELDENKARVLDENGKPKLKNTGKQGWSLIKAVSLKAAKNESNTLTEVGLLEVRRKTTILEADTQYKMALKAAEANMDVSDDLASTMDKYLEKYTMKS